MEPIKIKKRARVVPFGFKQSQDSSYLEPVKEELDALKQAQEYLKTCSLRETAKWVHRKTGRYISHVGLRKRINSSIERIGLCEKIRRIFYDNDITKRH